PVRRTTSRTYWTQDSVTTGKRRRVLLLLLPATWPIPLSQMWIARYCQPWRAKTGGTVAQPSSLHQNQRVGRGVACRAKAATWGSYHAARPFAVGTSPGKSPRPYGPSETITVGAGH